MDNHHTPQAPTKPCYSVGASRCDGVYGCDEHYTILADDSRVVADIPHGLTPEAKTDAEFIVRACNNHHPLVSSLRRMTEAAGRVTACWERGDLATAVNDLRATNSEATLVLEAMTETA